jgi:hypothetical protein
MTIKIVLVAFTVVMVVGYGLNPILLSGLQPDRRRPFLDLDVEFPQHENLERNWSSFDRKQKKYVSAGTTAPGDVSRPKWKVFFFSEKSTHNMAMCHIQQRC